MSTYLNIIIKYKTIKMNVLKKITSKPNVVQWKSTVNSINTSSQKQQITLPHLFFATLFGNFVCIYTSITYSGITSGHIHESFDIPIL